MRIGSIEAGEMGGAERADFTRDVALQPAPDVAAVRRGLKDAMCGRCRTEPASRAQRTDRATTYRCASCASSDDRAERLRAAKAHL